MTPMPSKTHFRLHYNARRSRRRRWRNFKTLAEARAFADRNKHPHNIEPVSYFPCCESYDRCDCQEWED